MMENVIFVDISGAIPASALDIIFIHKDNFDIIPFGYRVFDKVNNKSEIENSSVGGTNFESLSRYINKEDYKNIVIVTDLISHAKREMCKFVFRPSVEIALLNLTKIP